MSETRRVRSQLRQSLVQHVFHYYEELKNSLPEEEAKRIVSEEVSSLLEGFTEKPGTGLSLFSSLEKWEKEWLEKERVAQKEKDYDMQYLATDALQAIQVLKPFAKEREEKHGN